MLIHRLFTFTVLAMAFGPVRAEAQAYRSPANTLAIDPLKGSSSGAKPTCPMPVAPMSGQDSAHRLQGDQLVPRTFIYINPRDSSVVDTLRLLPPSPVVRDNMPVVRSGCINTLYVHPAPRSGIQP